MKRITTVVGARPQFIKYSLLGRCLRQSGFEPILVHTGQHYDPMLSQIFFSELNIPEPDVNLGIGSDTPSRQIGRMMMALEEEFATRRPDGVLVFGDTNSTLAAALTAIKANLPLIHVEAGVRGHNRALPEEHNRRLTDHLADLLVCHHESAAELLRNEKVSGQIAVLGDIMRETVAHFLPQALERCTLMDELELDGEGFGLLTIHRPTNADDPAALVEILNGVNGLEMPVVFPIHPRTRKQFVNLEGDWPNVRIIDPLSYLDMLAVLSQARLIVTDSGGLQKESLFVGTPCVTLRGETEWIETTEAAGLNLLTGDRPTAETIRNAASTILRRFDRDWKNAPPEKLDQFIEQYFGPVNVSSRIARALDDFL